MSRSNPFSNKFLELQNLVILYEFKFDPVKSYMHHSQEMILTQELKISEKVKMWDLEKRRTTGFDGFEVYEREVIETGEFRNLLNRSMFLTIFSMFEQEFFQLCRISGGIAGTNLTPKDLSGRNYIGQSRKFILKVLQVSLDNLQNEWEIITKFQFIRNSIAHNGGIVKKLDQSLTDFIDKTEGLSINKNEIVVESDVFLMNCVNHLVNFLVQIIQEIIDQKGKESS